MLWWMKLLEVFLSNLVLRRSSFTKHIVIVPIIKNSVKIPITRNTFQMLSPSRIWMQAVP